MKICTIEDLLSISTNGSYELAADIDFNGQVIERLLDDFRGELDGKGHAIKNVVLKTEVDYDEQIVALINTTYKAVIKNIVFENVVFDINCGVYIPNVAILCGECEYSTLENITISSNKQNLPMIALSNHSSYSNCVCDGKRGKKLVQFAYSDNFIE